MKQTSNYYKSPVFKDYSIKNELMYNMFNDFALNYTKRKDTTNIEEIIKHKCISKKS